MAQSDDSAIAGDGTRFGCVLKAWQSHEAELLVDGVVVHAGGVPTTEKIAACLTRAAATPRCCG